MPRHSSLFSPAFGLPGNSAAVIMIQVRRPDLSKGPSISTLLPGARSKAVSRVQAEMRG